ncbi:PAS domain-containing sensor histidine kinase [Salinibaculum salinum]|uniref:sensor histidine kinase n=1 Tax=Salinibaculum salinum TaxID=3131996 RepID=UPI0030EF9D6F
MGRSRDSDDADVGSAGSDAAGGEFLPYPYQSLNGDAEIQSVNEAWLDATGFERTDVEGEWFGTVLTAASTDQFEASFQTLESEGRVSDVELELVRSDGSSVTVSYDSRVEYDENGEFVRTHGQFHSHVDRSDDLVTDVIEAVPHPLYVLDVEDYTVQQANSLASAQEGETCYEVTHQRDVPCHEGDGITWPCPLQDVTATGEPTTVEHTHYDENGDERIHELHAAPLFDSDGTVVQMVESAFDVTERVEYEERLREQRDNLEVLNQVVRHDIRNDLQLVTAYAELLADHVDDVGQEHVETLRESADHAVELTETAREMADVMLTTTDSHDRVNLRSTLETELDEVRTTYPDAAITVDGSIPAVPVLANDMLDSVFRNLLKNAIQHNDKDLAEVTVSVTERDTEIAVEVGDNGPGIPDGQKDDIFAKGETGLESEGTGIGLYLVQTLVSEYGGTVTVTDNDPDGAVFTVTLPLAD